MEAYHVGCILSYAGMCNSTVKVAAVGRSHALDYSLAKLLHTGQSGHLFKFLCSKSQHLSSMLLHTSELLGYPWDKQHCSVPPEEDVMLCYRQGWDSKGPIKRCWCSRQTWCLCYGNALYIWCLSNPCVFWDPFERNPWPCQVLQSGIRRKQGRTPLKLHKHSDCVTHLASGDSCGLQQGVLRCSSA